MEPLSHTRKMRQEFSVAIRRQKKQEIFQSYRMKLKSHLIEEQQSRMLKILDTPERREEWLLRKARDLTGIPDQTWIYVINELHWSLLCFKGKGCFLIWIETQIIKNLCSVFYEENSGLGLSSQVAKLLGAVIHLEEDEEQQKTSYVAKEIFNQEILRNLILLSENTTLPHNEISQYMTLIANLAAYEPRHVICYGGFTVCVQWALRMLKQKKLNRSYLEQIYSFLLLISQNLDKVATNYNFSHQVLNLINQFIQVDQTVALLTQLLSIIQNILRLKKQAIYSTFVNFRPLTKKVFQLAIHDNERLREASWLILGHVTSGNLSVIGIFEENHFINAMITAYEMQPIDNANFDKITSKMLICVNNLILDGDKVLEQILCSPLINMIIDSTHTDRSINLRKDAYYCLSSIVRTQNYRLFNKLVFELPILQKFIIGLETMITVDKPTIEDILRAILELIKTDNEVFRGQGQGLRDILDSKFGFIKLLQRLEQVYAKNHYTMRLINSIYDLYSC